MIIYVNDKSIDQTKVGGECPKNGGVGGVVVVSTCMGVVASRTNILLLSLPFEIQIRSL